MNDIVKLIIIILVFSAIIMIVFPLSGFKKYISDIPVINNLVKKSTLRKYNSDDSWNKDFVSELNYNTSSKKRVRFSNANDVIIDNYCSHISNIDNETRNVYGDSVFEDLEKDMKAETLINVIHANEGMKAYEKETHAPFDKDVKTEKIILTLQDLSHTVDDDTLRKKIVEE